MITAAEALSLVASIDRLYEAVASDPGSWDEPALAMWIEDVVGARDEPPDRGAVRLLRRSVRQARKLARYWEDASPPADWRSAVDEALGSPGWEPTLSLARDGLDSEPTEELFELVRDRFRVVHFQTWSDGVEYEEWLAQRDKQQRQEPSASAEGVRLSAHALS